ncbi:MAG TPA: thioesterase family protein [Dokdonella sp.]
MNQPRKPARKSRATEPRRDRGAAASARAAPPPTPAPSDTTPTPLASVPVSVRWGDLDAFNHVNNATFLVYAQEARLAWLAGVEGIWFDETMMPVVAAAQVNYRRQLAWPAEIVVELDAKRLGQSSLTLAHRVVAARDRTTVYADGEVVMVWIDPASGRSVPLPDAIRAACQSPLASAATTSK